MALSICSCVPNEKHPAPTGPHLLSTATAPGFAVMWVNTDFRPVAQPQTIGTQMIGIATRNSRLYVIGIDPATGRIRWQHEMTVPQTVTRGKAISIAAFDDRVGFFRAERSPAGGFDHIEYTQLVVVDARTGGELASSPLARFTSQPYRCANRKDVCVLSHGNRGGSEHQYRLDVAKDDYIADSEGLPPYSRVLEAPGLLDLADRPGNTLAWLRDRKIQWRIPASAAFPPGFSSDSGWSWHRFAEQRVFVGSLYGALPSDDTQIFDRDLAATASTVGLAEATGEVLWRDPGSALGCLGRSDLPVRCRRRGVATVKADGPTSYRDLDVTVEGFDPTTGKTSWSAPVGAARLLVDYEASTPIAGPMQIVIPSVAPGRGPIILDYAAGSVTAPAPGATYWCLTHHKFYMALPDWVNGERRYDRPGGKIASVCDAEGHVATALPGAASTLGAGAQLGDHAVVATQNGYVGFKLR